MLGEHSDGPAAPGEIGEAAACLLLIRAPSDWAIYEAFRALATNAPHGACAEHLWIEGDLPLTSGLCAPEVPATLERLLNADCEMIDKLELEFGGLKWTYVRSGGHAPFRESFFDEVRVELVHALTMSRDAFRALMDCALSRLHVLSHSGTALFTEIIGELQSGHARDETPASGERRI